jgi:molecular chaperone GrpE
MTGKELETVFQRNGISRIEAIGAQLDPNRHQAMVELASDEEPGTIVQEMQTGYMLKDRLLRPSLVGVAKKPD